jgi:hypothetical protein
MLYRKATTIVISMMINIVTYTFLVRPIKSNPADNSLDRKNAAIPIPIFITIIRQKSMLHQTLYFQGFDLYRNRANVGGWML